MGMAASTRKVLHSAAAGCLAGRWGWLAGPAVESWPYYCTIPYFEIDGHDGVDPKGVEVQAREHIRVPVCVVVCVLCVFPVCVSLAVILVVILVCVGLCAQWQ